MSHIALPRLYTTSRHDAAGTDGPSVPKLLAFYVVPLSLLPPLMYVYAQLVHPGAVLPLLEPALRTGEAALVGTAFFLIELLAVALMAMFIQQMGDGAGVQPDYADAYALAATAPTPLWLATLGLALPSLLANIALVVVAWFVCAGLIRRGVRVLFVPYNDRRMRRLANTLTMIGVATWFALLLFLVLLLSIIVGWR
ncbi:MAG: DUF1282 family protein [Rhodocyclaceae bacterium]|nr:DUF1282 family protein [Rhodocyclaceae bacterium]